MSNNQLQWTVRYAARSARGSAGAERFREGRGASGARRNLPLARVDRLDCETDDDKLALTDRWIAKMPLEASPRATSDTRPHDAFLS